MAAEPDGQVAGFESVAHWIVIATFVHLDSPARPHTLVSCADLIRASILFQKCTHLEEEMDCRVKPGNDESGQRLLRIGMFMSSIFSSRTGSSTAQATFGSTLTLKWYMLCSA